MSEGRRQRVLIVEDDENLRIALADNLADEGYDVESVATLAATRAALARVEFDLIVLDVMLPDGDGYAIAKEVRKSGLASRILMLTARTLEDDLVRGLDAGADDYLAKPYRLRELLARLRALSRRGAVEKIRFAGFELDLTARTLVDAAGAEIALTRTEFDLLAYFLGHPDRVLKRDEILDAVWGHEVHVDVRTVDNFVSNLKKKLGGALRISTVRGVGYRVER